MHERTFQSDLLALFLKAESERRARGGAEQRIIVMSATLQGNTFGHYFSRPDEPVGEPIFVGAKRFEVEEIYLDEVEKKVEGLAGDMVLRDNVNKAKKSISSAIARVKDFPVQRAPTVNPRALDAAIGVIRRGARPRGLVVSLAPRLCDAAPGQRCPEALFFRAERRPARPRPPSRGAVAAPGRTVLVFLPGQAEIERMLFLFQLEDRKSVV